MYHPILQTRPNPGLDYPRTLSILFAPGRWLQMHWLQQS